MQCGQLNFWLTFTSCHSEFRECRLHRPCHHTKSGQSASLFLHFCPGKLWWPEVSWRLPPVQPSEPLWCPSVVSKSLMPQCNWYRTPFSLTFHALATLHNSTCGWRLPRWTASARTYVVSALTVLLLPALFFNIEFGLCIHFYPMSVTYFPDKYIETVGKDVMVLVWGPYDCTDHFHCFY